MTFKPIEDYGIIGDLNTIALVGLDGSIDWCCFPQFDSPSIFASLLDPDKGGRFRIYSDQPGRNKQHYIPDTNVLITRFLNPDGVGEVTDFMPIESREVGIAGMGRRRIVRRVSAVRGSVKFRLECLPAFDYGRAKHEQERTELGVRFTSESLSIELLTPIPLEQVDGGVAASFVLEQGQTLVFILQHYEEGRYFGEPDPNMDQGFISTVNYWHTWLSQCNYKGRWREMVHRSALVLKLLTYAPTGAIIAAPTTSLPEFPGGTRNWDYRYTWIRDASFTLYALLRIGFTEEATQFMSWLEQRLRELGPEDTLGIMYRIDGTSDLEETTLPHLRGYLDSLPVRIGNGAHGQLQLDVYGALLDAIYMYDKFAERISYDLWKDIRYIVNWVCRNWRQPDEGIWEVRGGRRQFVYSKLMCWVAIDRAIRLAYKRSYPSDREYWESVRDEIYTEIMEKGWNEERQAFTQYYGSDSLDAANLLMPLVLFIAPNDPRMRKTLDATFAELTSDSLVYRYRNGYGKPGAADDGIEGDEGTFSMCTFWLSECLCRAGRLDEARMIFEKMMGYANHLGLYSEEIGPSGEALGNFPQAFTHLGLISAAFNLDRALDNRDG